MIATTAPVTAAALVAAAHALKDDRIAGRERGGRAREQRRLADAGFALDQHYPKPARRGGGEHLRKRGKLLLSPYERLSCRERRVRFA